MMQSGSTHPVPSSRALIAHIGVGLRLVLLMVVVCSIAYPAVVTVVAQSLWPGRAAGSFVSTGGRVVGSELIGQAFTSAVYFHPRPSSTGYDAMDSGSANLGALSDELRQRVRSQLVELEADGTDPSGLPAEWVTESASALDPHITPRSARSQVPRVSQATGIPAHELVALIRRHSEPRWLGLFGLERVNVLRLNLELYRRLGASE